jgi:hypothetical protein
MNQDAKLVRSFVHSHFARYSRSLFALFAPLRSSCHFRTIDGPRKSTAARLHLIFDRKEERNEMQDRLRASKRLLSDVIDQCGK